MLSLASLLLGALGGYVVQVVLEVDFLTFRNPRKNLGWMIIIDLQQLTVKAVAEKENGSAKVMCNMTNDDE